MNRETHYAAANKCREGGGSRIQSVLSKLSTPASCFMLITMVLHGGAYNAASMWRKRRGGLAGLAGLTATYLMNLLRLNRSRWPLGGAEAGAGAGEGAQAEVAAGVAACTSVGI